MHSVPTHDIQKVIFDKNYMKFIRQREAKQMHEFQAERAMSHTEPDMNRN